MGRSRTFLCDEYGADRALLFGKRAKSISVPMVKDACFFSRLKHIHPYTHIPSFQDPKDGL